MIKFIDNGEEQNRFPLLSSGGNMPRGQGFLFYLVFSLLSVSLAASSADSALSEVDRACMGCHESDFSMTFGNKDTHSLKVDKEAVGRSVHQGLGCSACHGFTSDRHPHRSYRSKKEFRSITAKLCIQCHALRDNKIHMKLTSQTSSDTLCTDCHGAHAVKRVRELAKGNQYCLGCHGSTLHLTFKDGEKMSLQVREEHLNSSVHKNLSCMDCHFGFSSETHPVRTFKSQRDYSLAMSESCRRCHFDKYTRTLEGIHFKHLIEGNTKVPVCTDCHGAHSVYSARRDKLENARRCEKCHKEVYDIYANSVHGGALIHEHIEDVPICSDCHKAHDNAGPQSADFRISVPQLCSGCHGKSDIMNKYGLSTAVVDTYLQDFHGVTMRFYRMSGKKERQIAVCIDCHGVHDIARIASQNSPVIKQNLVKRCQKCHPGATTNFPDSWVSHYKPSLKHATAVYFINLGYKIFIPFMIVGLLLQIVLHMWRYAVNR